MQNKLYSLTAQQIADLVYKIETGILTRVTCEKIHKQFVERKENIMKNAEGMPDFNKGIYYEESGIQDINEQIDLGECILLIMKDLGV